MEMYSDLAVSSTVVVVGILAVTLFKMVSYQLLKTYRSLHMFDDIVSQQNSVINHFATFFVLTIFAFLSFLFAVQATSNNWYQDSLISFFVFIPHTLFYISGILFLREGLKKRKIIVDKLKIFDVSEELDVTRNNIFTHLGVSLILQLIIFLCFTHNPSLSFVASTLHISYVFLSCLRYVKLPILSDITIRLVVFLTVSILLIVNISLFYKTDYELYGVLITCVQIVGYIAWVGGLLILLLFDNSSLHYRNSVTDSLTGIYNRRYFINRLKQIIRTSTHSETTSLIVCDIDNFKAVNDNFGHDVGDMVITHFAKTLESDLRSTDIIARIGGEEFGIILPHTSASTAQSVCERMRKNISSSPVIISNSDIKSSESDCQNRRTKRDHSLSENLAESVSINITGSFGISALENTHSDVLIKNADIAMYEAKKTGKNKVVLFGTS